MLGRKIRVLVVDDSAIVRKLLTDCLSSAEDIEVVGTAPDPFVARDKILALSPDVLTLDLEMPRMNGVDFLKRLMHFRPMPVIVISSLGTGSSQATMEAMAAGAVEVLAKPSGPQSVGELSQQLVAKVRAASVARVKKAERPVEVPPAVSGAGAGAYSSSALIAIGASTGGTEAIHQVLRQMPGNSPGVVIAQHIPAVFSRAFAERMDSLCPMRVREARDGDAVEPGLALIAPGNFHLLVRRVAAGYQVAVKDGPLVCYQRPAVDVLFRSVAQAAGAHAVGAILTGMGNDGAEGLFAMKQAGGRTFAQDEASCVVFGMPREAIKRGGVDRVVPLSGMAEALLSQARHTG